MSRASLPSIDDKIRVTKKTTSAAIASGDKLTRPNGRKVPTKKGQAPKPATPIRKSVVKKDSAKGAKVYLLNVEVQDIDDSANDYTLNLGVFGSQKAAERVLADWALERWLEGGGGVAPWSPSWDDENYPLEPAVFKREAKKYKTTQTDKQFIDEYFDCEDYASYSITKKTVRN